VGSTVFGLNKVGDLPNAVGGRDIFGGKVDKGYSELKLIKIEGKRFVHFLAYDVNLRSTETTMARYSNKPNLDVDQSVIIGSSDSDGIPVVIDTEEETSYSLSGIRVEIIRVRGSSMDYMLHNIYGN